MEMARSPAFKKEAETMRIDVDPVTGEDMQKVVPEIIGFPASVKERAAHFVE